MDDLIFFTREAWEEMLNCDSATGVVFTFLILLPFAIALDLIALPFKLLCLALVGVACLIDNFVCKYLVPIKDKLVEKIEDKYSKSKYAKHKMEKEERQIIEEKIVWVKSLLENERDTLTEEQVKLIEEFLSKHEVENKIAEIRKHKKTQKEKDRLEQKEKRARYKLKEERDVMLKEKDSQPTEEFKFDETEEKESKFKSDSSKNEFPDEITSQNSRITSHKRKNNEDNQML